MLKKLKKAFSNTTLGFRILVAVGFIIMFMTGVQLVISKNSADIQEKKVLEKDLEQKDALIKQASSVARANLSLAIMIANMESVKECVGLQDRERLYSLIKPMVDTLNKTRQDQIKVHFHLPPGKSFLRVWKPEKYGDDISGFRKTVVKVLHEAQPVYGIEAGRVGLGIRGVAPVFWEGSRPVGSVEVITDLSKVAMQLEKNTGELNQVFAISNVKATAATSEGKNFGRFKVLTQTPAGVPSSAVDESFLNQAVEKGFAVKTGGMFLISAAVLPDYAGKPTGVYVRFNDISALKTNLKKAQLASIGTALLTAALAIFFICLVVRVNLNRPIQKVMALIDQVTSGDLTHDIKPSGARQMQQLCAIANNFIFRNGSLITMFQSQGESLKVASSELSETSVTVDSGASEIDEAAERVAAASSEAASALESVARSTEELREAANEIAGNVAETAAATNEAQEKSQDTNLVIKELGENSQKIGGIIEVINSIAEQTNLLALNATIEAARAGDAGKGFAVVANEVKELAKQTSNATDEIAKMIHVIQTGTAKAVTSVEDITATVSHVNDLASTIASAAEEQTATVAEINEAVAAGASKVKELEGRAHGLADQASEIANLATRVENVDKTVGLISTIISEATSNFVVDDNVLERVFDVANSNVQLTGALFSHFSWLEKLQTAVCQNSYADIEIDPRRCYLGRWIENHRESDQYDSSIISELAAKHHELHRLAEKVNNMMKSGNDDKKRFEILYEEISPVFFEMSALVKRLRRKE